MVRTLLELTTPYLFRGLQVNYSYPHGCCSSRACLLVRLGLPIPSNSDKSTKELSARLTRDDEGCTELLRKVQTEIEELAHKRKWSYNYVFRAYLGGPWS